MCDIWKCWGALGLLRLAQRLWRRLDWIYLQSAQVPDRAGQQTPARLLPITRRHFPRLWRNGAEQPWERQLPAAPRSAAASAWQPCGTASPLGSDRFRKWTVLDGFTVKSQWLKRLGGMGLWNITSRTNYHSLKRQHALVWVQLKWNCGFFLEPLIFYHILNFRFLFFFFFFVFGTWIWWFRCTVLK